MEDTKIRALPPAERAPLRDTASSPAWEAAFTKYLAALGCTLPEGAAPPQQLQWLLSHAVGLETRDSDPQRLAAAAAAASTARQQTVLQAGAQGAAETGQGSVPPFPDAAEVGRGAALGELCKSLGVPYSPPADGAAAAELAAAAALVVRRHLTPAALAALPAAAAAGKPGEANTGLEELPLGFDVSQDAVLQRAAMLLRMQVGTPPSLSRLCRAWAACRESASA